MKQVLPRSGEKREALRIKGQFWTPDWIADAMVAYVLSDGASVIFDPAVGEGAFLHAARRLAQGLGRQVMLRGTELDGQLIEHKLPADFSTSELAGISRRDFVLDPPREQFNAIVANPPYIRHHRLSGQCKKELRTFVQSFLDCKIDGRAGLHIYFLLRALQLLKPNGRLSFIVPSDTFEGVFAPALWGWIAKRYQIESVVTFAPQATPFPGVDTNAVIVCIKNVLPGPNYHWAQCSQADTQDLTKWLGGEACVSGHASLRIERRNIGEWVGRGLSREQRTVAEDCICLGDLVRVMRGVATGANEFFFLTRKQARELHIPEDFLRLAVGRTRDVETAELTAESMIALGSKGRPTLLFCPDGRALHEFPEAMQAYLKQGDTLGYSARSLIATRRPWYKMESRIPPPFLFAYLGRRNVRFIRNSVGAIPLTGFLCIYPKNPASGNMEKLWQLFKHPEILDGLASVGKSYGGGAIKVEPRSLERLPIPKRLLEQFGLISVDVNQAEKYQMSLMLEKAA